MALCKLRMILCLKALTEITKAVSVLMLAPINA